MREVTGDLWTVPADVRIISTNGDVNRREEAVMGRGCAREAKQRYPELAHRFAMVLREYGNHVAYFPDLHLVTFPVKHHWHERADPALIQRSAHELRSLCQREGWQTIAMPRPGCGNGQLRWDEVRPVLATILDDRFVVVHWEETCKP